MYCFIVSRYEEKEFGIFGNDGVNYFFVCMIWVIFVVCCNMNEFYVEVCIFRDWDWIVVIVDEDWGIFVDGRYRYCDRNFSW